VDIFLKNGLKFTPVFRFLEKEKKEKDKHWKRVNEQFIKNHFLPDLLKKRQMSPIEQITSTKCLKCEIYRLVSVELVENKNWKIRCNYCGFKITIRFKKGRWKLVNNNNDYATRYSTKEQKKMKKLASRSIRKWLKIYW